MMTRQTGQARRTGRGSGIAAIMVCGLMGALWAWPATVAADELTDQRSKKTYWQSRYRNLLTEAAELRKIIAVERELYADANRRNYRRGTKRHVHRKAMKKAIAELALVEADLATIEDDGRREGALPGWFYEVELEIEDAERLPAISVGPGEEGRNPLYQK